jgi:hypothetical protein
MGNRLKIDISETDEISSVDVSGVLDEDNGLAEATEKITRPIVAINTADIERINSCGVRDWVTWLGVMEKAGKSVFLVRCPPVIISQVNLVKNFVGAGTIVNFYCPYFCSKCDGDNLLLVEVEEAMKALPFKAPACRCAKCDFPMEFDEIESSYFAFLEQMKKKPVDATLAEKILGLSSKSEGRIRTRSTSMPMVTLTPSISTPSSPTVPSASQFKSLLSDLADGTAKPVQLPRTSYRLLYLVVALLAVAVGLLTYLFLIVR